MTELGNGVYKKPNGAGGYTYYGTSCGIEVVLLDTAVCSLDEAYTILGDIIKHGYYHKGEEIK